MARSDFAIAVRTWLFFMPTSRGRPRRHIAPADRHLHPFVQRYRRPNRDLREFGGRLPNRQDGIRRATKWMISSLKRSPAIFSVRETTVPPMEMTAMSVVPPPISTMRLADGRHDRQSGAERRSCRRFHEIYFGAAGVQRRVLHRFPLHFSKMVRDRKDRPADMR